MNEVKTPFKERYPFLSKILIAVLILALTIGIAFGIWSIVYWAGGTHIAPTLEVFTDPQKVFTQPKAVVPTQATMPTVTEQPTDPANVQPQVTPEVVYVYITPEPTAPPQQTAAVTAAPTVVITTAPVAHATYTLGEEITVNVDGKEVVLRTFTYSGGYIPADDPWFAPAESKENENSYGAPIYGQTPQELTYNWLRELCKSPHQIIRLRTQMGMIKPKTLAEEDRLAFELAAMSAKDYDKVVNETLSFFFKKLKGGRIESSTDWSLENYMLASEGPDDTWEVNLHGRVNHDDDTEKKDILLTFYAKGAKKTFVSSNRGFKNTLNDAKTSSSFSARAWVNMTEGGTWKWKDKGGNDTPSGNVTPNPDPTSTPEPSKKPRPTKNPEDRPKESDAPVGYGPTNPENSTDPQTTSAPVSTPAPAVTAAPVATEAPTAVPTAVVRPTEVCETTVAPLIREDTQSTPAPEPAHSTPKPDNSVSDDGNNNGGFDPDSI